MKKILGFAGAIALSIIPTPSFSGEVLTQIGREYKNLNIKEITFISIFIFFV